MLSENIYKLRRESGLSQEQLAEKIGVSRQTISKWEGGLSKPELDKLKALSEFFQITLDELTGNQAVNFADTAQKGGEALASPKKETSKAGVYLCLTGAVCLILLGILTVVNPASAERIRESSMITLNGTGILAAFFVSLMILGIILIFKKK